MIIVPPAAGHTRILLHKIFLFGEKFCGEEFCYVPPQAGIQRGQTDGRKIGMTYLEGTGPVDLRTTSWVGTIKGDGGCLHVPSIIAIKSRTAPPPMASRSCRIVVSGGVVYSLNSIPSKLAREISSGTRRLCSLNARRAPTAITSLAATIAVKSCRSSSSWLAVL